MSLTSRVICSCRVNTNHLDCECCTWPENIQPPLYSTLTGHTCGIQSEMWKYYSSENFKQTCVWFFHCPANAIQVTATRPLFNLFTTPTRRNFVKRALLQWNSFLHVHICLMRFESGFEATFLQCNPGDRDLYINSYLHASHHSSGHPCPLHINMSLFQSSLTCDRTT